MFCKKCGKVIDDEGHMKRRVILMALVTAVLLASCNSGMDNKSTRNTIEDNTEDYETTQTSEVTTKETTEETTEESTSEQTTTSSESVITSKTPKFLPEMLDYSSKYIGRKYLDVEQNFYDDFRMKRSDCFYDRGDYSIDHKNFQNKTQSIVFEGKRMYLGWDVKVVDNSVEIIEYVMGFTFYSEERADDSINKEFEEFYDLLESTYGEPEVISFWVDGAPAYVWNTEQKASNNEDIYLLLHTYSYRDWDDVNDCEIELSGYYLFFTEKYWK